MKIILVLFVAFVGLAFADTFTYSNISLARYALSGAAGGGKVLFGYGTGGGTHNRIDIYDEATDTWSNTNYGTARYVGAAAYADGLILFGGGFPDTAEVTIYNTTDSTFSTSSLSLARNSLAAAGAGQRILFAGGQSTSSVDLADIYFTNNGTWGTSNFYSGVARSSLAGTSLNNKLYFGGGISGISPKSDVDIYNVDTDEWEPVQYLSQARSTLDAAAYGELVLFAGGVTIVASNVVDILNVTSGIWEVSHLSAAINSVAMAANSEGLFVAAGGFSGSSYSPRADIYDPELHAWHLGQLEIGRGFHASAYIGNKTFIAGGISGATELDNLDIFEMSSGCRPRSAAAAVVDDSILFMGGLGGGPDGTIAYSRIDVYHNNAEVWSTDALSKPLRDSAAASAAGIAFIGGGFLIGDTSATNFVEMLNVTNGTKTTTTLSVARAYLAATATDTKVLFAGGYPLSAIVDIFDPITGDHLTDSLSVARYHLAAATARNFAFFAGGTNSTHALDTVDIYINDVFPIGTTALSVARYNLAGAGAGDVAFFAGGENGTHFFAVIDVFNYTSVLSHTTMSLATPRSQLAATTSADGRYVAFGGGRNDLGALDTVEVYSIPNATWSYEVLSVASYGLSVGAVGDYFVFMAGKTDEGTWSCAVDKYYYEGLFPSSSSSSSSSSILSSSSSSSSSSVVSSVSSASSLSSASSTPSSSSSSQISPIIGGDDEDNIFAKCGGSLLCILSTISGVALFLVILTIIAVLVVVVVVIVVVGSVAFGITRLNGSGSVAGEGAAAEEGKAEDVDVEAAEPDSKEPADSPSTGSTPNKLNVVDIESSSEDHPVHQVHTGFSAHKDKFASLAVAYNY